MKRIPFRIISMFILGIMTITASFAQEDPTGFNFQAVARNADGDILPETEIKVILSIIDSRQNILWEETHNLTTSNKGLFNISVGIDSQAKTGGSAKSLRDLSWGLQSYTLNVSVNDEDLGSQPILPVPLALYGADEDADPSNEIQDLDFTDGTLSITNKDGANSINLSDFVASEGLWEKSTDAALLKESRIGVGLPQDSISGVMDIKGADSGSEPIFQVRNYKGEPVFAVYNNGVRVYIPDTLTTSKGIKGGFAVGGYNTAKSDEEQNFMEILPTGTNINYFADEDSKGSGSKSAGFKGGFAVGGYNTAKSTPSSYFYMDPYMVPMSNDGGTFIILPLFDALNEKGNCYMGAMAGQNHEGHFNTSIGYQAGYSLDATSYLQMDPPLFISKVAGYNTFLGAFSGHMNDFGDKNVYLGYQAGYKNTGSGNVFIGYQAGAAATAANNKLYIDNEDINTPLLYGDFDANNLRINGVTGINTPPTSYYGLVVNGGSNTNYSMYVYKGAYTPGTFYSASDIRYKTDIEPIENALSIINQLNGVRYNWNIETHPDAEIDNTRQLGVIAQEVESVLPELVSEDEEGMKAVAYGKLTAVLIQAIKEQQALIEKQQKEIEELKDKQASEDEIAAQFAAMQETIIKLSERIESMEKYAAK